jgi:8-oxo-dGTP pyrophosphatase MutT (NUDIX family)
MIYKNMIKFKEYIEKHYKESSCIALFVDDELLLLYRSNKSSWEPHRYGLVGGQIEDKETIKEAAIREMKEEIGYKLPINKLNKITIINEDNFKTHIFAAKVNKKPNIKLNKEHDKYVWCSYEECLKLPLVSGLKNLIHLFKNKKYFSD